MKRKTEMRNTTVKILGITLTLLLANACRVAERKSFPPESSRASESELREWFAAHHIILGDRGRSESLVGRVSKRIGDSGIVYYVHDLAETDVGFILEDATTYHFTTKYDAYGTPSQSIEYIGNFGVERGVRRLLGLTEGEIELRPLDASSPQTIEEKASESTTST